MLSISYKDETFQMPTHWAELSFSQLDAILRVEGKDDFEVVRAVLGIEKEAFYALPKDVYFAFQNSLLFVHEKIDLSEEGSGFIFLGGSVYELPKDLGNESIAQYKDAQIGVSSLGENATMLDVMRFYCKITATYLQPLLNGGEAYDYSKAQKLAIEIEKSTNNGLQILKFGNFFLGNLVNSRNGTTKAGRKQMGTLYKKWQATIKLLKRLVLPTPLKS